MRPIHDRLVREAKRRDPKFAPRPFDVKALERVRRIPDDDYRAFLLEVGRLTTPSLTIGPPADFDMTELPEDFLPFAADDDHVYAFGDPVDRTQLAEELRERAAGAKGAERARIEGELEALRDGPIETGIGTWNKHDGEITRSKDAFADWLERMTAPKPEAPVISTRKPAAAEAPDAKITRALDLIDLLVAAEKLEVDASFDENACAKKLAVVLDDDAERIAEVLVDVHGVVELYATEDEIETALSRE